MRERKAKLADALEACLDTAESCGLLHYDQRDRLRTEARRQGGGHINKRAVRWLHQVVHGQRRPPSFLWLGRLRRLVLDINDTSGGLRALANDLLTVESARADLENVAAALLAVQPALERVRRTMTKALGERRS